VVLLACKYRRKILALKIRLTEYEAYVTCSAAFPQNDGFRERCIIPSGARPFYQPNSFPIYFGF
ncbi:MAG TPA: hypothetical protein VFU48_10180, partial [Nitrospira sp.]|nr:hypothetical protein [Nitrospira sp.]